MNAMIDRPDTETPADVDASARQTFTIHSESAANWFLRQLAQIDAEKARVKAQADAMQKELDADAARLHHLYDGQLQEFVRQELEKRKGRGKTLRLLQGTCRFVTVPAGPKVTDEAAALQWAKATAPELVKTTEALRVREYLDAVKQSGEVLPGVEMQPERESFSLSFGKREE